MACMAHLEERGVLKNKLKTLWRLLMLSAKYEAARGRAGATSWRSVGETATKVLPSNLTLGAAGI